MALQAVQALEKHLQSADGNPETLDRTQSVSALVGQLKLLEIPPLEKNEIQGRLAAGSYPFTAEEKEQLVASFVCSCRRIPASGRFVASAVLPSFASSGGSGHVGDRRKAGQTFHGCPSSCSKARLDCTPFTTFVLTQSDAA